MKKTWLIGCAGRRAEVRKAAEGGARECDAVEFRLDLLEAEGAGDVELRDAAARIGAGGRRVVAARRRGEEGEGDEGWAERWGAMGADVEVELGGKGAEALIRKLSGGGVRVTAVVREEGRWPLREELEGWEATARRAGAATLKVMGRMETEAELEAAAAWVSALRPGGLGVCAEGIGEETAGSGAMACARLAVAGNFAVYGALGEATEEGQPGCGELAKALGREGTGRGEVLRVERKDVLGLRFACAKCGQHLEAGREDFGGEVQCPACGQRLQVPDLKGMPGSFAIRRRR